MSKDQTTDRPTCCKFRSEVNTEYRNSEGTCTCVCYTICPDYQPVTVVMGTEFYVPYTHMPVIREALSKCTCDMYSVVLCCVRFVVVGRSSQAEDGHSNVTSRPIVYVHVLYIVTQSLQHSCYTVIITHGTSYIKYKHMYIHTYIHPYTHTHIHTYIHTYNGTCEV